MRFPFPIALIAVALVGCGSANAPHTDGSGAFKSQNVASSGDLAREPGDLILLGADGSVAFHSVVLGGRIAGSDGDDITAPNGWLVHLSVDTVAMTVTLTTASHGSVTLDYSPAANG